MSIILLFLKGKQNMSEQTELLNAINRNNTLLERIDQNQQKQLEVLIAIRDGNTSKSAPTKAQTIAKAPESPEVKVIDAAHNFESLDVKKIASDISDHKSSNLI